MNIKKFLIVFFVVFSVSAGSFASPRRGSDLVPSGHWLYDALASVEIDFGRWNFVDHTPLTIMELKGILEEIPYEKLSEAGKSQYLRIQEYFSQFDISLDVGLFSLGIEPKLNVDFNLKTNTGVDWLYNYHERQRLLEAPIRLTLSDYLTVYMGLAVGQRRSYMQKHYNYVNHVFYEDAFDPNITHSTYLSTGYRWNNGVGVNLNFGMGSHNFGRASLGSVVQSDYLTDLPYGTFRFFSPIFSYAFNVQQLNQKETMYNHEIDFRLFKKFTLGFLEGGAAYDVFDMKFLNPFGIFHAYELNNQYDWISYMGVKVNFVPCKNLRFYGLMARTEHQMFTEQTSGAGALPEGDGFQGGVNLQFPVKGGFLKFNLEGYYASPYLWIKQSPNWSLVSAKGDEKGPDYEWIGSPVGPDSIAGKFSVGYEKPGKWSLDLNYIFAARGEFSSDDIFKVYNKKIYNWINGMTTKQRYETKWIYVDNPAYANGRDFSAPHGIVEYDNVIYLKGSWSPLKWLTFVAQPAYIFVFNHNHTSGRFEHDFEIALSCRMDFCRLLKKPVKFDFLLKDKHDREAEKENASVESEAPLSQAQEAAE
ncbi:MAG: hypothetical protein K6A42_08745 [Treponema sp.]|nr:hypothetical protein [Treponema sp.]